MQTGSILVKCNRCKQIKSSKNGDNVVTSSTEDLCFLPVSVIAEKIANGQLSSVDVVDAFLARIAKYDNKLHAYVDVYRKDVRLAADAADKAIRSGHAVGPFHGVPIALKDLIELNGRITTGGSAHFRNRRSVVTATIAQNLIANGVIILGKTHTVEFAYSGWGTNRHLGTPWNPWDNLTPRTPGGSSSGSAVAVAAGLAPWAIGTDTGGSVRLPASFCGLTGLKTTIGRVSTDGIIRLSQTLDTAGPLTRSVLDAALLYNLRVCLN
jgi:aspartyl-tRNA(Asn)/glutamyl-tRNA(Gln) amidotransferase subunit A